ncbi:hypothetical protein [Halobacteriovorax sp. HLS]|uniref:hypothetical protein n=1 Tax=Halobacteriovorax sp. HLS TaxID=2234000 RepID=UPI000FDA1617|nr:hypothetical protein [Halobacteriovorax sp. HLS]
MKILLILSLTLLSYSRASFAKEVIGNRHYIANTLNEIFGKKSVKYTDQFITSNIEIFGAPCNIYDQVRIAPDTVKEIKSSCFDRKGNHKAPISPNSSILRSGYMIKVCKLMTADELLMNEYFMKKGLVSTDAFNTSYFLSIYNDFYPYSPPTEQVIESFKKIHNSSSRSIAWNYVTYALCISNKWQVI